MGLRVWLRVKCNYINRGAYGVWVEVRVRIKARMFKVRVECIYTNRGVTFITILVSVRIRVVGA